MKTQKLTIRLSDVERAAIDKAVMKYHKKTGAKPTISGYIRHVTKEYVSGVKPVVG